MQWKDITTYSHGDRVRTPRVWELDFGNRILLTVHRHIYYEDTWLMSGRIYGAEVINMIDLHTNDVEQAKAKAKIEFRKRLAYYKEIIETAMSELSKVESE